MSKNPFAAARNPDWQNMRLSEWEGELNEKTEHAEAAQAAQEAAATTGMPISDVVIQRGIRGRLGGDGVATVGRWLEVARFICAQPETITIQSNIGTMTYQPVGGGGRTTLPPNQDRGPGGQSVSVFPTVCLRIRTGAGNPGGGKATGTYFAVAGEQFQVTATYCTVDVQIFDDQTSGNLIEYYGTSAEYQFLDLSLQCPVSVSIGLGSPASAEMPTKWIVPQFPLNGGANGLQEQTFIGPGRVKQATGFNANGTSTSILYLMFFDTVNVTPPPNLSNGAYPFYTIPVPGGSTPFSWDNIKSSRAFTQGLAWAVSSTGDTYTAPIGLTGYFRVDVELYAGAMEEQDFATG